MNDVISRSLFQFRITVESLLRGIVPAQFSTVTRDTIKKTLREVANAIVI